MKSIFLLLTFLLIPIVGSPATRTISYAGTINKNLPIHMKLKIEKGLIKGSYYYDKNKVDISLEGKVLDAETFEIEEMDKGKTTGVFRGEQSGLRFEGNWFKAGSTKGLPFELKADRVYTGGSSAGWAGEWNYTKANQFDTSTIDIGNEQKEIFDFEMMAGSGGHTGQISGTATISGKVATWNDPESGCKVTMNLKGKALLLETTDPCSDFGGMGVNFFNGEYRQTENEPSGLVKLGVLQDATQEKKFRELTGANYELFVNSFQLISEVKDLDHIGVKGTSGGVRGLFTEMEAIILHAPDGRMYAAAIDSADSTVKYFTNDPAYAKKLPKTIEDWRSRFADKKVVFVPGK